MTAPTKPALGAAFGASSSGRVRQRLRFMLGMSLFAVASLHAQTPTPEMAPMKPELELRLKKLETELRCLVCQNQTLAESPAGLAGDLRREIRMLADAGKNDDEIKQHLKARYGDFILYRPPLESKTWLLWFGPFALLLAGGVITAIVARRQRASVTEALSISDDERRRANALLEE